MTLTGHQITLTHGAQVATLATLGAALRTYTVDGRDVVLPYGEDEFPPAYAGMVLAPWPNRLRDGRYTFAGEELQVPVSEPDRGTALHGLASFQYWAVGETTDTSVTFTLDLAPSPGYPFQLALATTYALSDAGLSITTEARNIGPTALPYGVGFHPWFAPGGTEVDACTLQAHRGQERHHRRASAAHRSGGRRGLVRCSRAALA
ncbi:hypothetical protein [Demequina litorisediminis]|uniref:Aldose 1-epimerase n=1 Tax=Demequina litorisediminis TaxID=1849022 RepID=A0ABQ6IEW7_9MICO|nr:hypothetical protein GCM10025876_20240 [Demequina litorisediminis]